MLIQAGGCHATQEAFFAAHIDSWVQRFFTDMAAAGSAVFYKAVARFGNAFMGIEKRYFTAES
jgi:TorA maturation chaperone TorD